MWLEHLRVALAVLRGHKFRSFLTVSAVTIGTLSIVLMTSLAESGQKTLWAGVEQIGGTRMIIVWRKPPDAMETKQVSYAGGLTPADVAAISHIPHLEDISEYVLLRDQSLEADTGRRLNSEVVAGDARFLPMFGYHAAEGRLLDAEDQRSHSRVCVIGHDLADKLFGAGREVIGRYVSHPKLRCRIVGRLARLDRWGVRLGWDWDAFLAVPSTTFSDRSASEDNQRQIILRTDAPGNNDIVKRIMNARLMARHHGVDDFAVYDFERRLSGFVQFFFIMKVVVGLIAGITLLVGGVGIMNMMLVSISERVREIGIRKALGASPTDIARQFIVEAMLLSGMGGLLGIGLGAALAWLGSRAIQHFKPAWVSSISRPALVMAFGVALLTGLIFGYFPARRAGRLHPVAAMRR